MVTLGLLELGTGNALLYAFTCAQRLTFLSLSNRTSGDIAVKIYFVRSGGSPSDATLFVPGLILAAHDVWPKKLSLPFEGGDSIQGFAASAGVNFMATFESIPLEPRSPYGGKRGG